MKCGSFLAREGPRKGDRVWCSATASGGGEGGGGWACVPATSETGEHKALHTPCTHSMCLYFGWLYSLPTPATCASPERMLMRSPRASAISCITWMNLCFSSAQQRGENGTAVA